VAYRKYVTAVACACLVQIVNTAAHAATLTTLATFDGTDGAYPIGGLTIDTAGNLYGTASAGGLDAPPPTGYGSVFEIPSGTNKITPLAFFTNSDGANPISPVLMDSAGNLYGTAENGGPENDGTVYEIAAGTNTIMELASFDGANGATPYYSGMVMDGQGNF